MHRYKVPSVNLKYTEYIYFCRKFSSTTKILTIFNNFGANFVQFRKFLNFYGIFRASVILVLISKKKKRKKIVFFEMKFSEILVKTLSIVAVFVISPGGHGRRSTTRGRISQI